MPTLFNPVDRLAIEARLKRLAADAPRQWGKMSPAQMLAHCSVGLEMACGGGPGKQKLIGKLLAPLVRKKVLGAAAFGRNSPTDRAMVITDARDLAAEKARLLSLIGRFCERGEAEAGKQVHVFFGRLDGAEWGRLMGKHLDHHLRQFAG